MRAVVDVKLKDGVLDPQGKAVSHALSALGFSSVSEVRIGKQIVLEIDGSDEVQAKKDVKVMCEELLANTVIEDYDIKIVK